MMNENGVNKGRDTNWALQSNLNDFSLSLSNATFTSPEKRDWPSYNKAQTKERQFFFRIADELMRITVPETPTGHIGRPRMPLGDMIKSLLVQKYEEKSSRRTTGYLQELENRRYIEKKPHFNTSLKYLKSPAITPYLQDILAMTAVFFQGMETTIAIDSTGFSTTRFNGWLEKRHEQKPKRRYIKFHAVVGAKTGIIASLSVTPETAGDSPQFDPLVRQAVERLKPQIVTADKAYSSRANLELGKELGIIPLIPFKSNATGTAKGSPAWKAMYNFYATHYVYFMKRYHQRSNVEAVFSSIKRKLTDSVRGKSLEGNINELILVAIVHNVCVIIHELVEMGFQPNQIEEFMDNSLCATDKTAHKKAV